MLRSGQVLQKRYRVECLLGQGGMGEVYKASHLKLGTTVAIKALQILSVNATEQQRFREQFEIEARILGGLSHANLARVTDFFEEGPSAYLVMEFIDGVTIEQLVNRDGPLPEHRVLTLATQLLDALDYLHTRLPPVILRDLKPSNVMLCQDGGLRIIDFGIAKILAPGRATRTVIHGLGSEGYAPLEQYGTGQTDQRSDIYALGATMLFMLSGQVPPGAVQRVTQQATLPSVGSVNSGVSRKTVKTLTAMMALSPADRPASVCEVRPLLLPVALPSTTASAAQSPTTATVVTRPMSTACGAATSNGASWWDASPVRVRLNELTDGLRKHFILNSGIYALVVWGITALSAVDTPIVWLRLLAFPMLILPIALIYATLYSEPRNTHEKSMDWLLVAPLVGMRAFLLATLFFLGGGLLFLSRSIDGVYLGDHLYALHRDTQDYQSDIVEQVPGLWFHVALPSFYLLLASSCVWCLFQMLGFYKHEKGRFAWHHAMCVTLLGGVLPALVSVGLMFYLNFVLPYRIELPRHGVIFSKPTTWQLTSDKRPPRLDWGIGTHVGWTGTTANGENLEFQVMFSEGLKPDRKDSFWSPDRVHSFCQERLWGPFSKPVTRTVGGRPLLYSRAKQTGRVVMLYSLTDGKGTRVLYVTLQTTQALEAAENAINPLVETVRWTF